MKKILQMAALIGAFAAPGMASAQDTITVGMATGVNQVPSLVAAAKGFFTEEGLNVDIKPVPRGNIAIEAIVAGSMQFAESSGVGFLSAVDRGIPLMAIGAASRGFTGKVIAAPDLENIHSFEDLKGKRIGIQVGTGVHGVFLQLLEKKGMSESDFQVSNVRVNDMPTAMASSGSFDAVFGWDPMMQRIVQAGYGKEVISAAKIQEMAGITYPLLLVADQTYVENNRETVQKFVNAYQRAHAWIRENPEGALKIFLDTIHKAGAPLEEEIVRNMMYEVDKFGGVQFIDTDWSELGGTAEFLHKTGKLSAVPDLKAITDTSFASE